MAGLIECRAMDGGPPCQQRGMDREQRRDCDVLQCSRESVIEGVHLMTVFIRIDFALKQCRSQVLGGSWRSEVV